MKLYNFDIKIGNKVIKCMRLPHDNIRPNKKQLQENIKAIIDQFIDYRGENERKIAALEHRLNFIEDLLAIQEKGPSVLSWECNMSQEKTSLIIDTILNKIGLKKQKITGKYIIEEVKTKKAAKK